MQKKELFGEEVSQKIALLGLSPLDGRYDSTGEKLNEYFSEYALIRYRVFVEISWLDFIISHIDIPELDGIEFMEKESAIIWSIYYSFSLDDAISVKKIENKTKHDVKAVEYFIAQKFKELGLEYLVSLVHIGCTSEDINNTAYALMLAESLADVWIPSTNKLIEYLRKLTEKFKNVPMLGHTHGQHATPVTVGKEFAVYVSRLENVSDALSKIKVRGKFNGATGCYSAINIAFPNENWPELCKKFVTDCLGLHFNPITTQIESHDYVVEILDALRHFNNILMDLNVDMWLYISKDYIKQIPVKGEVGSSVMPHKVNPIWFENSEANVEISNGLLVALSNKLPHSRMQRDLSDSSAQRNIGMAIGYSLLSISNTLRGLKRCDVNEAVVSKDLEQSWEVLAEPIQTMLRKYSIPDAYDQLKKLTRGKSITKEIIHEFILSLDVFSDEDRETLLNLSPDKYTGYASEIASNV